MTAYILISTYLVLLALAATNARAETRTGPPPARIAETVVATWRCQDKLPVSRTEAADPWTPHHPGWKIQQLNTWLLKLSACRNTLTERARQWNWSAWLPDKWRRIGMCETGLNWQHSNSSFQGAFGFAIQSWDTFRLPGYPPEAYLASPWQQYMVALRIYNRYGFSGWGCRNA